MEKKYLIIGHGIAGCVLAMTFYRKGIPFEIIGMTQPGEASMASSGLINPVTGRRYVKAWMIDDLIAKAIDFYRWTEEILEEKYFFPVDIVRFLSNPEAIEAWKKRSEDPAYEAYISSKKFESLDELKKPYGIVTGGYRLETFDWITAIRKFLSKHGFLQGRMISLDELSHHDNIIYATGAIGKSLSTGIIPNKGEAITVHIPGWKWPGIIKDKVYFIPLKEKDMYWIGSYYQPWPDHTNPTKEGKDMLIDAIGDFYPGEVTLVSHLAGIRPTVNDRRPLIGPISDQPGRYLLNGMGTKGTSLAPYWAEQLMAHLVDGSALPYIVSPSRYKTSKG